jgi:hypothetical protein
MAATIVDSYSETNQDSGLDLFSGSIVRCGQSFTPSFSGTIDSTKFYLKKTGNPSGDVVSRLYVMSSALGGNDDIPSYTTPVVSSAKINANTLTTSYQLISFPYINGEIPLVKGFNYVVSVEFGNGDASNLVTVGYDASSPSHAGNQVRYTASWSANAGDTCFYVYAEQLSNYSMNGRGLRKLVKVGDGMGRSG